MPDVVASPFRLDTEDALTDLSHAPTARLGARRDGRSVGELLRGADHLAREVLLDLTADDAPGLLRGWVRLVDSASGAWNAITDAAIRPPTQRAAGDVQPPPRDVGDPMLRLHAVTSGFAKTLNSSRWPGQGSGAPAFESIATTFDRVADLVTRRGTELCTGQPQVRADAAAAQMRLMHTVYLSAHATTSALQQHGRQLVMDSGQNRRPLQLGSPGLPYAVGPTSRWVQSVGLCEGIAGRHVGQGDGSFSTATAAEVAPSGEEQQDRLLGKLARWDVQAHRSIAADPSPSNLVLIGRTQAFVAATALPLLEAAARGGVLADHVDSERLLGAVAASGDAWNQVASRWSDVASAGTRPDPALANASDHLRAAGRALTHTPTGKATPADIFDRVDLQRVLVGLQQAAASSVDLAHLTRDHAANPDLTGPARPLSIRAHNDSEHAHETRLDASPDRDVLWVKPADVLANKHVPLPRPVADGLVSSSSRAIRESSRATALIGDGASRVPVPSRSGDSPRFQPPGVEPLRRHPVSKGPSR